MSPRAEQFTEDIHSRLHIISTVTSLVLCILGENGEEKLRNWRNMPTEEKRQKWVRKESGTYHG